MPSTKKRSPKYKKKSVKSKLICTTTWRDATTGKFVKAPRRKRSTKRK